jgi:hypothetical protein
VVNKSNLQSKTPSTVTHIRVTIFSGEWQSVLYCRGILGWLTNDDLERIWRRWSWPTRGIISTYFFRFWGKPREILVMIADVPAEIRIENLPNTSLNWFTATATGRSEKVILRLIIGYVVYRHHFQPFIFYDQWPLCLFQMSAWSRRTSFTFGWQRRI